MVHEAVVETAAAAAATAVAVAAVAWPVRWAAASERAAAAVSAQRIFGGGHLIAVAYAAHHLGPDSFSCHIGTV